VPELKTDNVPSTTTVEQDKHTSSARFNDSIWEFTQSFIALVVVCSVVYANVYLAIIPRMVSTVTEMSNSALMQLNVLGGIIVGFYFGRTNHARNGGVAPRKELGD